MNLTHGSAVFALVAALMAAQNPPSPKPRDQDPPPLSDSAQAASTAEAKRKAQLEQEDEFFKRCDQNGGGWISLQEAEDSLGLDASGFRVYDTDADGRISREEFGVRYRLSVTRVGAFKPPLATPSVVRAPTRNAEQLRNAYDKNGDGGLSAEEMKLLLSDYERSELPAELAVQKLDRDGSTRIDGTEIEVLARLLSSTVVKPPDNPSEAHLPKTLEELFGGSKDRSSGFQSAPMPPQIDGPVPQFRRLDLDGDGQISLEDLRRLQSPLELPVRAGAVLAALDLDGNGSLSPEEFAAALDRR